MSEYKDVERPLLTQLSSMGWDVHDLGSGIPSDPATSFRSSFREVVLAEQFKSAVHRINAMEDGTQRLTPEQLVTGHFKTSSKAPFS